MRGCWGGLGIPWYSEHGRGARSCQKVYCSRSEAHQTLLISRVPAPSPSLHRDLSAITLSFADLILGFIRNLLPHCARLPGPGQ